MKEKRIWALINSTSDISYMNSQLWWSLEIKKKKWKQSLIMKDAKWNEIIKIIKKMKKISINIADHQEQIKFSEMKISEHKIMLEMNWL